MRKKLLTILAVTGLIYLSACGGRETATSVAKKWCTLNEKIHKATSDDDVEIAREAFKEFKSDIEAKYKDNPAFLTEVRMEVSKCEGVSEGK